MGRGAHVARVAGCLALVLALGGCGSEETPSGTQILLVDVEEDLPHERRSALVGVLSADPATITFPDGEGSVSVVVMSARQGTRTETGGITADLSQEPNILRSIEVNVVDAAGYELSAALAGQPTNAGTADAPEHTRIVQVTRRRSGLTGTSTGQMSLRVQPSGVERL